MLDLKEVLISDGFQKIIDILPKKFDFNNERLLRDDATINKIASKLSIEYVKTLYHACMKHPSTTVSGRFYRDIYNTYRKLLRKKCSNKQLGSLKLYQLVYGNKPASRVVMILMRNGIKTLSDIAFVSVLDCERLCLRKRSREVLVEALTPYEYDNILERLRDE